MVKKKSFNLLNTLNNGPPGEYANDLDTNCVTAVQLTGY